MEFGFISIVLLVIAAGCILASAKILFKKNWIKQFLRGFAGISLLLFAVFITLFGLNIATYVQLIEGETIANISFKQTDDQVYEASISYAGLAETRVLTIEGDLFQVDARILRLAAVAKPYYKLDRISGRYFSIEQEIQSRKSIFALVDNSIGFDIWSLFKESSLGLVEAQYGSATYSPMSDGAVYAVKIGVTGLMAEPVNEQAKQVVNSWN